MKVEKFLKINLKNKIIASSISFLLVIFGLIYFIVWPTVRDIKAMGEEIDSQRIDLEKKYIKGQSLKQLTENLNKIEPKLELLNQIFINQNRELEFITSLENQANKNSVNQKINLSAPVAAASQNFQKIGLQLFTQGGFSGLLRYVMDLESLSYYINVELLELSPGSANPGGPAAVQKTAPAEINLNLYLSSDTYWN